MRVTVLSKRPGCGVAFPFIWQADGGNLYLRYRETCDICLSKRGTQSPESSCVSDSRAWDNRVDVTLENGRDP